MFFVAMNIHMIVGIAPETKQLYFKFTSYINLLDVFGLYYRVGNNRTGTII